MSGPKPGGFKLSFASVQNKNGLKPANTPPAKKPRLALGDEEPEDTTKSVEISGWDTATGGAIDLDGQKEEDEGPRVIPALPNRNRHEEAARKKQKETVRAEDNTEQYQDSNIKYGLTIVKKSSNEDQKNDEENVGVEMKDTPLKDDGLNEEQRLEKRALDALLNGKPVDSGAVIPAQTEEEAFERDYVNAPDAPTLDAYEATPIDGFGAAMLRGMGWKDGEEIGRNKNNPSAKPREIKRRPALLGIGAKEEAAVGIEFGEWGGGRKGKRKTEQSYNPIVLRNKVTGELVSEEELKMKLEAQEIVKDDKKERRDKYEDDGEKRYERRKEQKYKEKRDRDRRRDDDYYDPGRKKDKRRDDHYDSDRRREKRREPERRERDRDRSPDNDDLDRRNRRRDDGHFDDDRRRDKRRERERRERNRSRSRDSDNKRKRERDRDYDDERDVRKKRYKDEEHYRR